MAKILFTSIPKCGTHLLLNYFHRSGFPRAGPYRSTAFDLSMLQYVRDMPEGSYIAFHFPWRKDLRDLIRTRQIRVVFLYRDPRAQVVSRMRFIRRSPEHPFCQFMQSHFRYPEEWLIRLIQGFTPEELMAYPGTKNLRINFDPWFGGLLVEERQSGKGPTSTHPGGINQLYRCFAPWLEEKNCLCIRFEDIVGPNGGGDTAKQLETVRCLLDFTGTITQGLDPQEVAQSLFDPTAETFDTARVGSWRQEMSPKIQALFMRESSELLKQWGYNNP